ncbi:TetR/AcrR family transcriptional regulator [Bacterioplanoides sp.]|uniref:TetR/AcrR family transcriptional regulator n=1 Tax=Bacterioplanoides sp. TaxID=2066072 RepID=UPI003B5980AE
MSAAVPADPEPQPSTTTGQYHHGNLKVALLQAAVELIRETSVEKLSLRALARKVGVSQTAPYRHFKDKNHLLVEIAKDTFAEMVMVTTKELKPQQTPPQNVCNCGRAYLQYAIDNPERYKLVFGPSIENRENYPDLMEAGMSSFAVLMNLVEQGIDSGDFLDHCPKLLANACWTSMHGFASLAIDGFYQRQELPVDFATLMEGQVQLSMRAIQRQPSWV